MKPLVSFICPTYGRAPRYLHLLEEVVESFLVQDYPNKELAILNDCPAQTFVCDVPGVVIVNTSRRHATLGAKLNELVECASGEIILPHDDDDISLPGRMSQAVEMLRPPGWDLAYWNPQRTFFMDGRGLHVTHTHGVCHNASAFSRKAWKQVGRYPEISGAQDAALDAKLKALLPMSAPLPDDPATWKYIYRWGVSDCHLSGSVPHDDFYRRVGERPVEAGTWTLHPHWEQDYEWLARLACQPPTPTTLPPVTRRGNCGRNEW